MDINIFKSELADLFEKHGVLLKRFDVSYTYPDSMNHLNSPQRTFTDTYDLSIEGEFKEYSTKY